MLQIDKAVEIYERSKKKIEQDLDLEHVLKKLYEIDKLKLLLMNED